MFQGTIAFCRMLANIVPRTTRILSATKCGSRLLLEFVMIEGYGANGRDVAYARFRRLTSAESCQFLHDLRVAPPRLRTLPRLHNVFVQVTANNRAGFMFRLVAYRPPVSNES